jgi:hypothetical protein
MLIRAVIIAIDAFDLVGVGAGDADIVFDHQFSQALTVKLV